MEFNLRMWIIETRKVWFSYPKNRISHISQQSRKMTDFKKHQSLWRNEPCIKIIRTGESTHQNVRPPWIGRYVNVLPPIAIIRFLRLGSCDIWALVFPWSKVLEMYTFLLYWCTIEHHAVNSCMSLYIYV